MYNIPKVAPKTISKAKPVAQSKTVKLPRKKSSNDQKRLEINEKERQRTSTMNRAFDELKRLLNPCRVYSKAETLSMINSYITFLYRMANEEVFFQQYSNYSINMAFQIYLLSQEQHATYEESKASNELPGMTCQ